MKELCKLFGASKQAYYKHDEQAVMRKVAQEDFVLQYIRGVRSVDHGIGGMKLWHMYQRRFSGNCPIGRDRFEDIVDRYGLKVRNKVRKPRTTDSSHGLPIYPNLIKDLIPTRPNQLWVSDITYIPIWNGKSDFGHSFWYLSLILDAYTEEIIGWSLGPSLDSSYPMRALEMALRRVEGRKTLNLIHHSDRGCQYASKEYTSRLSVMGIRISMTGSGDPKENPQAERINNTIKNEFFKGVCFHSPEELEYALGMAIDFYNTQRPHMSIGMMTPEEAASCEGELTKKWKSYRLIAIKNCNAALNGSGINVTLQTNQGATSGLHAMVTP